MRPDSLVWIDAELQALQTLGLRRKLSSRSGRQGAQIEVAGRLLANFGSNDYLGLAGEALSQPVIDAIQQVGWGSGASPLVTGRSDLHELLETRLAEFEGTPAALLFTSGFAANCGTVAALARKGDVIFSDAKNHASIIDGCRLSGARIVVYPHGDMTYLEMMLQQASNFRRRLIVTDSLFSMDGDIAPLAELANLAERYRAMLMVDEAHATGIFGARGSGLVEQMGIHERVTVRIGTLSKALGSLGGFAAGPEKLIDWLANRARPFVFSTMLPAAVAAAGIRALEIVRDEPARRRELLERAAWLRDQLRCRGWQVGNSAAQIIPVFVGEPETTMRIAQGLMQRGFFVPGIRPPTVPPGESLLRISVCSGHSQATLQQLLDAFAEIQSFNPQP